MENIGGAAAAAIAAADPSFHHVDETIAIPDFDLGPSVMSRSLACQVFTPEEQKEQKQDWAAYEAKKKKMAEEIAKKMIIWKGLDNGDSDYEDMFKPSHQSGFLPDINPIIISLYWGSRYSHTGECTNTHIGPEYCTKCFKYSCPSCYKRSNSMLGKCFFCGYSGYK